MNRQLFTIIICWHSRVKMFKVNGTDDLNQFNMLCKNYNRNGTVAFCQLAKLNVLLIM